MDSHRAVKIKKITHGVSGDLSFPGDKSLSHRAIIFGALAEGVSSFTNVLDGEDCARTREAFRSLGVGMRSATPAEIQITGRGLHALKAPQKEIYLGNSGTSMRLLLGVLAGNPFRATLTGDPSLSSRPMRRVTDYLGQMGAMFEGRDGANFAPITVRGGELKAIEATLPVASAQVKSAILLAGLYARGTTSVTEPVLSRDHTENFLAHFGARVRREGLKVSVERGRPLQARRFEIPGDISGAAFFMALAALLPGSEIRFHKVLWNPTRAGMVNVLERMGARVEVGELHCDGPEPAADFVVRGGPLKSFEIAKEELPSLIDEVPVLCVLATQAEGTTVIRDASELRIKETDRIHSMVTALGRMGADIRAEGDTLYIKGRTALGGAAVDSFKDHRTAMSMVVAGLVAAGDTVVEDLDCVGTSFPGFFDLLRRLGIETQFFK
ncbi:MAG: 3-phosphoshikimate 1-carboxyvinyltransferase [Candidatus Omnitrophica bacterium]|nr:3-phosphoshikimate 1-carboxyvinyltransferase [Candidatus Omnitrophota bacterium]